MSLIPGFDLNLEKTSYEAFGAAVSDFGQKGLQSGGSNLLKTSSSNANQSQPIPDADRIWQSTKYAEDLIEFAPKHRFMFKVDFKFNPKYIDKLMGGKNKNAFTYLVKMVDRPKVEFVYEDVNYYNFRTKVLKEIKHEPLSMTFIDDIGNNTTDFFNAYRKSYSPISRNNFASGLDVRQAQESGMNFSNPKKENQNDSAGRGVLADNAYNVLESIIIRQIFGHGQRMCEYTFFNPRISRFDFDEVNHDTSEGNGLTVQFDYDALYISEMLETNGTPAPAWGNSDILGNNPGTASSTSTTSKAEAGTYQGLPGGPISDYGTYQFSKIPLVTNPQQSTNGTFMGKDSLKLMSEGINNSISMPEERIITTPENSIDITTVA